MMGVFNACGSKIFQNKGLKIDGQEIHYEKRDRHTGMYPLTLYPPDRFALSASTKFLDEEGSLEDVVLVAKEVLEKTRATDGKPNVPAVKFPEEASTETLASLSRVYIRDDLDEASRWHARTGHMSMKYLKRIGIKSLAGKKLPATFRCDSCIVGKISQVAAQKFTWAAYGSL